MHAIAQLHACMLLLCQRVSVYIPRGAVLGGAQHHGVVVHAQAPDWNDELQTARDLPQGSIEERLLRERALLQVPTSNIFNLHKGR